MRHIKILKQTDRQKITLCEDNGKKYLLREIEGDRREVYKRLKKLDSAYIPRIVSVSLTDKTEVLEEWVEGDTLSNLINQGHKFTKRDVYHIAICVLEAMEALHRDNIIHRDIKPENIIVTKNGDAYLVDYDIARIFRDEIMPDTEKMGSFGYAPIEQYGVMPTDFRTDIYSFGATMQVFADYTCIRGRLLRVIKKCKKLDPNERYSNAQSVRKALKASYLKVWIILLGLLVLMGMCVGVYLSREKDTAAVLATSHSTEEIVTERYELPTEVATEAVVAIEELEEPPLQPEITYEENEYFIGFESDSKMEEYSKYPNYHHVAVFSMYEEWNHLLFLDDVNKKGKIRLGKNNTLVDADITLDDGKLTVYLNDNMGHEFFREFEYTGQYEYSGSNPPDRKNADFVCCDMDYDGVNELMIGLNEGCIGVIEHQFYNNFNYCIGWCVKYDENVGFTLCEGEMFSKDYSFYMTRYAKKFNVYWDDMGEITGYMVEDGKVIPVY